MLEGEEKKWKQELSFIRCCFRCNDVLIALQNRKYATTAKYKVGSGLLRHVTKQPGRDRHIVWFCSDSRTGNTQKTYFRESSRYHTCWICQKTLGMHRFAGAQIWFPRFMMLLGVSNSFKGITGRPMKTGCKCIAHGNEFHRRNLHDLWIAGMVSHYTEFIKLTWSLNKY